MTYADDLLRFGISLLVFWLAAYVLGRIFPLKRYGVEVEPAQIIYRSTRFKEFLYKASERRRTLWKTMSNLSIVFGIGLVIYAVYFLSDNLLKLVQPGVGGASLLPVLPGLTIRLYWLPYFFLAASLGIIVHEAAHGIIAKVEGTPLESAGFVLFVVFLTGFVELNDERFNEMPVISKLRIISAGSFVNLVMFLIALLMMSTLFVNAPSGVVIVEVAEGSPLDRAGLGQWDVIYSVNGTFQLYVENGTLQVTYLTANVTPGDVLILKTSKGDLRIVAENSTESGGLGIRRPYMLYRPSRLGLGPFLDVQLYLALFWGEIIYSSLAIFNMLPLFPFDGDRFLFYMVKKFTSRDREVRIIFNALSLGVIAMNMILSFIKHGPFLI